MAGTTASPGTYAILRWPGRAGSGIAVVAMASSSMRLPLDREPRREQPRRERDRERQHHQGERGAPRSILRADEHRRRVLEDLDRQRGVRVGEEVRVAGV